MATAEKRQRVLDVAVNQLGITETPKNSNKTTFGNWFGLDGVAWCGIFVSWVYHHAGYPLGKVGYLKGFAGCQYAVAHLDKLGVKTTDPQPGDIVFFDWNSDKRYDHVGIFHSWKDKTAGTFNTIEGNTAVGNDSNGGQVMRRVRNAKVALFVTPKVLDL
ncbi:CHAP domain-containing protein [Flavobacterium rhizosphaerae]|uniref:CHAP domain-containing protein n=1 Tax=Flavobacterium rhizosphaerae TaxID=3163298 RepID=A0ABW8Z158_9FLAO